MPLDAATGQLFAQYRPGGRHGDWFWRNTLSFGIVKLLSKASIQKAWNRPSTQLIKATSCVDKLNATMKAEELS
jgi:hypothetical protein